MSKIVCFFLEPTTLERRWLRRYASGSKCSGKMGYHDAMVLVGDFEETTPDPTTEEFNSDPRWPKACACGYEFASVDTVQVFTQKVYRRSDTGELTTLHEASPGAMWDATWYPCKGPDGRCLVVKCPDGHDWMIDGSASNCTIPQDKGEGKKHYCWTRTGTPPNITVGKEYGPTCKAGGGSIKTDGYHGFLRNGIFT